MKGLQTAAQAACRKLYMLLFELVNNLVSERLAKLVIVWRTEASHFKVNFVHLFTESENDKRGGQLAFWLCI